MAGYGSCLARESGALESNIRIVPEEPSTPATSTVKRILIDLLDGPEIIAESLQKNEVKA